MPAALAARCALSSRAISGFSVRRASNGSPARKKDEFANVDAEKWFAFRRLLEKREVILPVDGELAEIYRSVISCSRILISSPLLRITGLQVRALPGASLIMNHLRAVIVRVSCISYAKATHFWVSGRGFLYPRGEVKLNKGSEISE
jgi:hypothetical protein